MRFKQIFTGAVMCWAASTAQAATVANIDNINSFADTVTAASGSFLDWQSVMASDTVTLNGLRNSLTDNDETTYVFSLDAVASIDMAFGATPVYNGAGNDLVLFFVGNNFSFGFDADAGGSGAAIDYTVADTGFGVTDIFGDTWSLSAALVDLDDFGFASGQQLQDFRVILGADRGYPALSLVGGFNTQPVVVPLPLPVLLFASGLGIFGLFARRHR